MSHDQVALFTDGRLRDSASEMTVEVVDPSTGQTRLSIPAGCELDVDRAVKSCRLAFEDGRWNDAAPSFKKTALHRFADLIAAHAATLDALDAGEMGKPVSEKRFNARAAADLLRFFAEAVDKVRGDVFTSDKGCFAAQRRVARGVVGAIVPWNFPTFVAMLKLGPALAAGNCVVLKPSELSSRSALHLAQLAMEAGLPEGVLNVVPGRGEIVGRALGLHMDVNMIAFTGSTEVGKLMMQFAGQSNMKPVMAECGGKSPHIVFDDSIDLDEASEAIARMLLTNQGQICSVGSRLLVEQSIESAVVEKISAHLARIVIGNALDPRTTFGPLASARQFARVMELIDTAPGDGAQLAVGGRSVLRESGGYFVEPTVFRNVPMAARIAQEEVFGPVLSVIPFRDPQEAIRIANATIYGLTAYVWTGNVSTAFSMAKGIRSSVRINAAAPKGEGAGYAASSEPMRETGIGVEGGIGGMESYLQRQLVSINYA